MTAEKALLLMSDIIKILVGAIKEYATGIGQGLSSLVQSVFLVTSGDGASATTSLSVFGIVILIFSGISLAVGLSRWAVNFVTSLGSRNR